jgi:hypothetical protein
MILNGLKMHIEERTYYEDEQKMEANWILVFIVVSSLSTLAIAIGFMYNENADLTSLIAVAGSIIFTDMLIVFIFKTLKLSTALSKKGFHYKWSLMSGPMKMIEWHEIENIAIKKSPYKGYGRKTSLKYGDSYTMNLKEGLALTLKNGKKKFFSLKDSEEFKRGFNKLEIGLHIS